MKEALELVVRSLGSQFSGVPGVAGAATTADGEAIVVGIVLRICSPGAARSTVVRPQFEKSASSSCLFDAATLIISSMS